jgi:hypothetical protein
MSKAKVELESSVRYGGFDFEYDEDNEFYQCRGEVMYDDEHDEMPEPELWEAGLKLERYLNDNGYPNADLCHSEKGWVEVNIN